MTTRRKPQEGRREVTWLVLSVLGVVFFALVPRGAESQPVPLDEAQMKTMDAVSSRALKTFAALVTRENYEALGFDAPTTVEKGTLGPPIREFLVRLDALREYDGETSAAALLSGGNVFRVPVLVDGRVRSSITILRGEEDWRAVSFGAPNFTTLVTRQRQRLMETARVTAGSIFLVRVAALNVDFLGYGRDDQLMLSPLSTDARFELTAAEMLPAEEVLKALVPAAREHNGLPS